MKHSISFALVNAKNSATSAIRMRISYAGTRVDIRTGESVEPEYWSDGRVVTRERTRFRKTASEINNRLAALATKADNLFSRFELLEGRYPTTDEIKAEFGVHRDSSPAAYNVQASIDDFVRTESRLNDWTYATIQKWRTLQKHLATFDADLTFSDLEHGRLADFVAYLHESGLRNTSIDKHVHLIRWYLNWAVRRNLVKQSVLDNFKPSLKGTDPSLKELIYLEWEELEALRTCYIPESMPWLEVTRDVYLFCCFTGLRYSDVAKLRKADVTDNEICIVTKKDVEGLTIELNSYSRAILDKYKDAALPRGLALPVQANPRMNIYLKQIAELAHLDRPVRVVYYTGSQRHDELHPLHELLSTHSARRTFVINALRLGISAEIIMSWTGHSSMQAMKPYYKIVDAAKQSAMQKFDTLASAGSAAPRTPIHTSPPRKK